MELKVTNVFDRNYKALFNDNIRFIINQGGTRSSKTYSLCQLIILYCIIKPNSVVSVVRKTLPALKATVMRDFFDILKDLNLYDSKRHNKTDNIYRFFNNSMVEFFSVDDEQKLRGRKRHILWINEANELSYEEFFQLNIRTELKIFFDFNPSDFECYIYDLLNRKDSVLIKSTYKDNPFLPKELVKEIEMLSETDEEYKQVYLYGEKYIPKSIIYDRYNLFDDEKNIIFNEKIYGLDFGYNHPTVLVECLIYEKNIYVIEKIYESYLNINDIIDKMKNLNISKNKEIICDSARPDYISLLEKAGYNVKPANKSVYDGIMCVKKYNLFISKNSKNIIKEIKNYSWKIKNDNIIDEPVKINDDAMDAIRYAIYYYDNLKNKNVKYKIIY